MERSGSVTGTVSASSHGATATGARPRRVRGATRAMRWPVSMTRVAAGTGAGPAGAGVGANMRPSPIGSAAAARATGAARAVGAVGTVGMAGMAAKGPPAAPAAAAAPSRSRSWEAVRGGCSCVSSTKAGAGADAPGPIAPPAVPGTDRPDRGATGPPGRAVTTTVPQTRSIQLRPCGSVIRRVRIVATPKVGTPMRTARMYQPTLRAPAGPAPSCAAQRRPSRRWPGVRPRAHSQAVMAAARAMAHRPETTAVAVGARTEPGGSPAARPTAVAPQ